MATLAFQKCLNHGEREAVARCPQCRSHFCRECVSEHAGRILCAPCLAKAASATEKNPAWKRAWIPLGAVGGLGLAWAFFLILGKTLLLIPSSFHDGAWAEESAGTGTAPGHASPDTSARDADEADSP
jgi:hypothetical protein